MPKRSSSSVVRRWPGRPEVLLAFERWARELLGRHPEILRVGCFGSYARGDAGVGSDLDVVIVVAHTDQPFPERLPEVTDDGLPVPADILVYTEGELARMRDEGRRFVRELDGMARWVDAAHGDPRQGAQRE